MTLERLRRIYADNKRPQRDVFGRRPASPKEEEEAIRDRNVRINEWLDSVEQDIWERAVEMGFGDYEPTQADVDEKGDE